jgi:hypothetical protein
LDGNTTVHLEDGNTTVHLEDIFSTSFYSFLFWFADDVGEDLDTDNGSSSKPTSANKPSSSSKSSKSSKDSSAPPPPVTPSLDTRAKFGANLFLLSGIELGHVMTTLEMECPRVLEIWGESKVEINVDEIPPKLFAQLTTYVSNKVGTKTHADSPEIDDVNSNKKKKRKTI